MPKILFLENDLKSLVNFRGALIKEFIDKKFEVIACVPPTENSELIAKINDLGARLVFIPLNNAGFNIFSDLNYIQALYRLIKKEKVDYLLACRIKPVIYAGVVARTLKVPHVFAIITGAGFALRNKKGKYFPLYYFVCSLYRIALKNMQTVFFQNNDDRDLFVKNKLVLADKTQVVAGSGVDLQEYPLTPLPQTVSFLFAARLLRDKGIMEYVNAARILKKQYPHIQFKMAGDVHANPTSISKSELESWIQEGVIDYLGTFTNLHQPIAESSVFVLPSYHEGISRAVLEAMAMGRPIITTDAPGCREVLEQGINGFLVPIKNIEKLINAIKQFIENPHLCETMGKNSRNICEQRFDVTKVNDTILFHIIS